MDKGMSLPEIGSLVDRPPGTVGYWVKKHGLVANGSVKFPPRGALPREELEVLLEAGKTLAQIAAAFEVPISRVNYSITTYDLAGTKATQRVALIRAARVAGDRSVILDCPRHGRGEFTLLKRSGARCLRCNSDGVAKRRRRICQARSRSTCRRSTCRPSAPCGLRASNTSFEFRI